MSAPFGPAHLSSAVHIFGWDQVCIPQLSKSKDRTLSYPLMLLETDCWFNFDLASRKGMGVFPKAMEPAKSPSFICGLVADSQTHNLCFDTIITA